MSGDEREGQGLVAVPEEGGGSAARGEGGRLVG